MLEVPDFDTYPQARCVSVGVHEDLVAFAFDDGAELAAPLVWLREFSPDAATHHPDTREQLIAISDLPQDLGVATCRVDAAGNVEIVWRPEGLTSRYQAGWLRHHLPGSDATADGLAQRRLWGADFALLPVNGAAVLGGDESALETWLSRIHVDGVGLLEGLPLDSDVVPTVPALVGTVRPSNFGETFSVENLVETDSIAYTSIYLCPHIDLATREYAPGLQFLFCLANDVEGGDSLLVDGFRVAAMLRDESPEHFEVLCTLRVPFANKAEDSDYRYEAPVLVLDHAGQLDTVRFTYWLRSPMNAGIEDLRAFYAAFRRFHELVEDQANQLRVRLTPGDMIGFDNRRTLHGRTAFDPTTGRRVLKGCYGEREELLSRLRVLDRRRRAREAGWRQ